MSLLKCRYQNILETSTVSLTTGSEDEDYPLYRLSDRGIAKFFSPTAAVTTTIKIDQGASPVAIDSLMIPSGHNLSGMTLDIKYSTDDVSYTEAVAQWAGAAGDINKEWDSLTKRFWKFIITSPASIPQIAELFLAPTYTWERNPGRPSGPLDPVFNTENLVSANGGDRWIKHGEKKRRRGYIVTGVGTTQRTNIEALNTVWDGHKPFWLCDHEGTWIYGKLLSLLDLAERAASSHGFRFEFLEVLAE